MCVCRGGGGGGRVVYKYGSQVTAFIGLINTI